MQHEGAPLPASPERHEEEERAKSPFDLEMMEPRQVTAITSALNLAYDVASDQQSSHAPEYSDLLDRLARDLNDAASTSDKALDIYRELVEGDLATEGTMNMAADMAPDLLRRNLHDPEPRQWILDSLVHMLSYRGSALDAAHLVIGGELLNADWLDEDTKHYLEDQLLKFT